MSSTTWPDAWTGRWIWSDRPALAGPSREHPYGAADPARFDTRVLFRRTLQLDTAPRTARLRITADSDYRLFVNGRELGSGPIRHAPRRIEYDEYRLDGALVAGENAVAVIGRFRGFPSPWWEPSPTSYTLGGGSLAAEIALDGTIVGTDESWRVREAAAWTPTAPAGFLVTQPEELLDARQLDADWAQRGYDDGDWQPATVLREHSIVGPAGRTTPGGEPWGAPRRRPVAPLTGGRRLPAALAIADGGPTAWDGSALDPARALLADLLATSPAVPAGAPGDLAQPADIPGGRRLLVVDFGAIVSGRLELRVDAPAGTTVAAALLEAPTAAALDSAAVLGYIARGADDRFLSWERIGGRWLVLLVDAATDWRLEEVSVLERLRPREAVEPFRSDDPRLDRIYDVALRTADLSSHDAYVDCPTREQRAWTGDSVVHQSVDFAANLDWSLPRWSPRLLAQPRPDGILPMVAAGDFATPAVPTIPDWSLHWIRQVHRLHEYTGDREAVAELMPVAENVLRWFDRFVGDDGLVTEVPGWVLIDWSPVQVTGRSAALNALLARAFRDVAELAEALGDRGRAAWARARHASIADGFEAFWDEERGAYRDTIVDGERGRSVSEHTAAAAVCAGIVPDRRRAAVRRLLLDRAAVFTRSPLADHGADALGPVAGTPVSVRDAPDWDTERLTVGAQPFFRPIVHEALDLLGETDRLPDLLLDWDALLDDAPTAFRECWEGGSYCHGWSATPARDLIVFTLGIRPAEPGCTRMRIAPRPGRLTNASGAAATPFGPVHVTVAGDRVEIVSPVPFTFVDRDGRESEHHAGAATTRL
ncbi:hypothetical protein LLS1_01870 [Leifsonia sp. LS1]|uniref:alpha-L-rhamnosidase-related protein n=1 Tax=Leifsonia sp. LS1 TaxID=2828483 RepID=UPI001CFC54C5|nr:alpha-L-rhamnosidase N-terminal domain-containing protein [Leifsonia sp. LS1]GIT78518.1 hypothetical protein LLS1_01870 [Leifsonia sp. LS1]